MDYAFAVLVGVLQLVVAIGGIFAEAVKRDASGNKLRVPKLGIYRPTVLGIVLIGIVIVLGLIQMGVSIWDRRHAKQAEANAATKAEENRTQLAELQGTSKGQLQSITILSKQLHNSTHIRQGDMTIAGRFIVPLGAVAGSPKAYLDKLGSISARMTLWHKNMAKCSTPEAARPFDSANPQGKAPDSSLIPQLSYKVVLALLPMEDKSAGGTLFAATPAPNPGVPDLANSISNLEDFGGHTVLLTISTENPANLPLQPISLSLETPSHQVLDLEGFQACWVTDRERGWVTTVPREPDWHPSL